VTANVQCGALWELLSYIQMHPWVIFCLFSVKRAPNSKILLHFGYKYDPLSIKINVEMGEMLLGISVQCQDTLGSKVA